MTTNFHPLAAAAIDFVTVLKCAPGGIEQAADDLAAAAKAFANAASPPDDTDEFDDCAFG
jgi:hypothetical protein